MTKTSMKKSREYLCFTKRDDSGKVILDSDGNLIPDYREEEVYRVRIPDNGTIYEWCIHHYFSLNNKGWIICDCDTGLGMSEIYKTRKEAYEHINEKLLTTFLYERTTDYYKEMYNRHREIKYKAREKTKGVKDLFEM